MLIGIDASRAFQKNRTGIEEYSYQIIKHLVNKLDKHKIVLYLRENSTNYEFYETTNDFNLPKNWRVKVIKWPYLWTQAGLSLEMLFNPADVLFVPAHTVPLIHSRNTVVTIHGLEYEFCPRAYSFWARLYMRWSIKASCRWAKKIIAVSNNTKQDLMKLYKMPEDKIEVIHEGYEKNLSFRAERSGVEESNPKILSRSLDYARDDKFPYLLFIGRLEERKNIVGIIKAFEILKEQYKLPHKLILAGKFGYGEKKIQETVDNSNFRKEIILPGYVSEEEKWELLENADVFLFPTFYEGFGLPVLEAQSAGCPVVAGDNSSILEIVNAKVQPSELRRLNLQEDSSALLIDPSKAEEIADAAYKLISNQALKEDMIKRGYENVKRFSWEKCAEEIAGILTK